VPRVNRINLRNRYGAGRGRRALQYEIDQRALLGDPKLDWHFLIVKPDILPLFAHHDEVPSGNGDAIG
jgi:hypothetical protein